MPSKKTSVVKTKPILIVKTGSALKELARHRGTFEDWIAAPFIAAGFTTAVVDVCGGEALPDPVHFSGVVVTGSHALVTDREDWSEKTAAWIPGGIAAGRPFLGICYGHQLLAHALGGTVAMCPDGPEYGTVTLRLLPAARRDSLMAGLPGRMKAQACHTQSVVKLPRGAVLLASSDRDPHHAFAVNAVTWGLQFHPEIDADIMRTYIRAYAADLTAAGQDPQTIHDAVTEAETSTGLLSRFATVISRLNRNFDHCPIALET